MNKQKDHFHGSDLEKIENLYGIKKEDIISFGANVNPLGISPLLRSSLIEKIDAITAYPDRDYVLLRKTIADYCRTDFNRIIVGNGSTELISLFIQLKAPRKAMILGPTYSEYEREIKLGGGKCVYFPLEEEDNFILDRNKILESLNASYDLLVLCNPNNPTSTSVNAETLSAILEACQKFDIFVMIDETYVEFVEDYDSVSAVSLIPKYDNLVILRGISKFFAAPGLRLGYGIVGSLSLLEAMNSHKNPWTINSLAEAAGQLMFSDTEYISATKKLISAERNRILEKLHAIKELKAYTPSANFILIRILKEGVTSEDLFDACIRRNYMIRDCSSFPYLSDKYFRFCFMNPGANNGLLACIEEFLLEKHSSPKKKCR